MDIVILMHKNSQKYDVRRYAITHIARNWLNDGHHVFYLFGHDKFVPADIAILHVDLSYVPDEYIEFSKRYPRVVNGKVRDIRKQSISENRVLKGDNYAGRVIVKSNYNFAGIPERMLGCRIGGDHDQSIQSAKDYKIFERINDVPELYFKSDFVIEKFIPELDGDLFVMRSYVFLGDKGSCYRTISKNEIVRGSASDRVEPIETDKRLIEWRNKLQIDYGKFDYVINNGNLILLDANKTVGVPPPFPGFEEALRRRADGIYSFFNYKHP